MERETTMRKIWNVISPVIVLFVLYFGVIYGGMILASGLSSKPLDDTMGKYFSIVVAVALVIITIVEYLCFFKKDYVVQDRLLYRKPVYFAVLFILGAAFSHGLNLLVSLFNINGIFGDYQAVENEIFAPGVVLVIIRALILAPIAEELVFRGLVFRRMKGYTNFWIAAVVSSVLFGLYHMNLAQGIYAFLFGILLCLVYRAFENLFAPIMLHFSANLLSVILTYTKAAYPSQTVYIISMVVMFLISAAVYLFVIRKIPAKKNVG